MTIDTVPTTPAEEVLIRIGDLEEKLITSAVIDYILNNNDDDVDKSTLEALRYIVANLSKRVDEEVGDVKAKFSQLLKHYRQLLKDLNSNPNFATLKSLHIFGGTSKTEADRVYNSPDSRRANIKEGFVTDSKEDCKLNSNSYYYLDDCD